MAYPITDTQRQALGQELTTYYDEAWTEGVHALFDRMARANMGKATAYLDVAKDSYATLRKKSSDAFMVTFQAKVRQSATLYFSNLPDVAADALPAATAALEQLADKIPVPVLGTVIGKLISFASAEAMVELRERAVLRADEQITGASGGSVGKRFTNEEEATQCIEQALVQYKTIGRYLGTIPATITSFQDAITFPSSIFKVQAAASSLNVSLTQIRDYLEAMQGRLDEIHKVYVEYKVRLNNSMPTAVDAVLRGAYNKAWEKGNQRLRAGKPGPLMQPVLPTMTHPGAATQLAQYVSYCMAYGVWDAMAEPLPETRARSRGAAPPPPVPLTRGRR